jgi:hypothetical protein
MFRAIRGTWGFPVVVAAALALAAGAVQAQSTTTHTKSFEILEVDGNDVVVREADGTREYTLPSDFRFTVGDKQIGLQELKPGMKGKATITTTTTVKPVFVTEVKNGQVMKNLGAGTVLVRTADSIKMFSQGEIDKRGIRVYKDARPVQLSDLHEGDKLTATFVTEGPPKVLTEKQVEATIAAAAAAPAAAPAAAATAPAAPAAATAPATTTAAADSPASAPGSAAGAPATTPETKTAPAEPAAGTTTPATTETAGGQNSWLMWGGLIILVVIVAVFLFRRSGN